MSRRIGLEHTTLLADEADTALRIEWQARPAIGDACRFPAIGDRRSGPGGFPAPGPRRVSSARLADLPKGKRLGSRSLRRQWATGMKETPLKELCYTGGWKRPMTVLTRCQQPDTETQREALARRKRSRADAGG